MRCSIAFAMRALASALCARKVEPVSVRRRIISRIRSSSTFEPLRKAICTMRPSSAAARKFRSI